MLRRPPAPLPTRPRRSLRPRPGETPAASGSAPGLESASRSLLAARDRQRSQPWWPNRQPVTVGHRLHLRGATMGRKRLFRFAAQGANAESADEWIATARRAEELGYSALHVSDHYLGPGGGARSPGTRRGTGDGGGRRSHDGPARRMPGVLRRLPHSRRARQGGGDDRAALEWPPRARARRRMGRQRVRGARHPVRPCRHAHRPPDRDDRPRQGLVLGRHRSTSTATTST